MWAEYETSDIVLLPNRSLKNPRFMSTRRFILNFLYDPKYLKNLSLLYIFILDSVIWWYVFFFVCRYCDTCKLNSRQTLKRRGQSAFLGEKSVFFTDSWAAKRIFSSTQFVFKQLNKSGKCKLKENNSHDAFKQQRLDFKLHKSTLTSSFCISDICIQTLVWGNNTLASVPLKHSHISALLYRDASWN